jgi:hypothetical protein
MSGRIEQLAPHQSGGCDSPDPTAKRVLKETRKAETT